MFGAFLWKPTNALFIYSTGIPSTKTPYKLLLLECSNVVVIYKVLYLDLNNIDMKEIYIFRKGPDWPY